MHYSGDTTLQNKLSTIPQTIRKDGTQSQGPSAQQVVAGYRKESFK